MLGRKGWRRCWRSNITKNRKGSSLMENFWDKDLDMSKVMLLASNQFNFLNSDYPLLSTR